MRVAHLERLVQRFAVAGVQTLGEFELVFDGVFL